MSVGLLGGLVVVAAAQLAGLVLVLRVLPPVPSPSSSAVGYTVLVLILFGFAAALVTAVAAGLWKGLRSCPHSPPEAVVGPDRAPGLWELVRDLAATAGTRPPDEIRLMAEINVWSEETLLRGRRRLRIGLPLLQMMTLGQFRFALAHHVEHFSAGHTRTRGLADRCGAVVTATAGFLHPANPAGWAFRTYAWVYTLIDRALLRRQEYRADAAAARVAGPVAGVEALRETMVLIQAWRLYVSGHVPADVFGGFAEFVAAHKTEVDDLRAQPLNATGSWRDPFPPMAARAVAITARFPAAAPADERPAAPLIPDLAAVGLEISARGYAPESPDGR
ncbi:hypothetical protein Aph01nite_11430 [Acrocarpospora phusangensis]|uniref:Peptidase M48 domain-containing protein n=1 Tax=Acrocarpospora phusangensis TaxID=1070424 RepID=A0A919UM21_9ACTN|nr:hypothetical protein Aph01nite_11430 [Acrocarpospora phusangensis]